MAFDAFFLSAVLEEVRTRCIGARVEKIHQPARDTVIVHLRCQEGREKLNRLAADEYAVIYITEQLAEQLSAEISRYSETLIPAIIQIPGISGNTGAGIENVKKSVETAVGSDSLFSNE